VSDTPTDPTAPTKREALERLLGVFSPREALDAVTLDATRAADHVRHLVEYTIADDLRVRAFLLEPLDAQPGRPGVVAIHQDGASRPYDVGKSEPAGVAGDPELHYGLELCRRGYVVLCPDRFPFESRSLARSPHRERFDGFRIHTELDGQRLDLTEDLYRGCVANRLLFQGRSLVGQEVYELRRALDYVAAHPLVNAERLGAIGHSAGGLYAALLMYLDDRVRAAAVSSGTFLFGSIYGAERLRPINGLGGLVVPGMAQWGDMDDVLAGVAPRAYMESQGRQGMSDADIEAKIARAKARYAALDAADHFSYAVYPGGHVFPRPMRERSYDWLDRWL
jgi:dienelactone hydrolase